MKFNNVEITPESIAATRAWFADNAQACIDEATVGEVFVNDLTKYVAWQQERMREAMAGAFDRTFTFAQRAYFIQTGESVPMFSSASGL